MKCPNCMKDHGAVDVCAMAMLMGCLENRLERKLTDAERRKLEGVWIDDLWDLHLGPAVDALESAIR